MTKAQEALKRVLTSHPGGLTRRQLRAYLNHYVHSSQEFDDLLTATPNITMERVPKPSVRYHTLISLKTPAPTATLPSVNPTRPRNRPVVTP